MTAPRATFSRGRWVPRPGKEKPYSAPMIAALSAARSQPLIRVRAGYVKSAGDVSIVYAPQTIAALIARGDMVETPSKWIGLTATGLYRLNRFHRLARAGQ